MALFGKKKQDETKAEEKIAESAAKSKELDIILEARKEEEEERQARIAKREAEQEEYKSALNADMEKFASAAKDVIGMFPAREGEDRFFMLVESHVYTEPVNEGDEIVRGILRGTVKKGQEIQVLSVSLTQVDVSGAESLVASVDSVRVNGTLKDAGLDNVVANTLAAEAVDSSGAKVTGVTIAHDTISVTAALYQTKTVPLELVTEGEIWEGSELTEVRHPDHIVIKGPASMLSQISSVSSEPINIEGIYEDRLFDIIPRLEEGVFVSDTSDTLVAQFVISEYGQLTFKYRAIDIKVNDLADDLRAAISIPDNSTGITATVTGPVTTLRTLAAGDVVPTVSVKSVTAESQQEFVLSPYQNINGLKVTYQPVSIMILFRKQ